MTGRSGGTDSGARPGWRWDVALSFAGAHRDYVGQVAAALKAQGVRCFYDADEQVRLWGTHLAEELPRIYANESAAVVVFVSADYAGQDWTRLERRATFSRAVTEAGVYVLPARFDDGELPGLLPDVVAVDLRHYTPGQFADLVVAKLADLGVSPSPRGGGGGVPAGGVRVSEADTRRLGVHAAISAPGVSDDVPPEYVPRDVDINEFGVRAKVAAAKKRGGFVLLVGGSSVGKTRCAAEAVKVQLPDWWLVHPAGPDQVAALAAAPPPQTVVWLDELQRYLDGERGLTGAVVRTLLNAPHPVVIIGTLWPDRYAAYTTLPAGGADPHTREREVLDLAAVVRISAEFSPAEQNRARAAATRDGRLAVALGAAGYGMTQTLAAAPQLVARWEDARAADPYAWAVLAAALDAARLGAQVPLSADLLRAAAPGYCTSQQQAEAPGNWFEQALAYATGKLHGGAAALSPAATSMGRVVGYVAADYLIQHASRERRSARVPASAWDAVLSHIRDPADAARLAYSAQNRLLYRYAILLYRRAADAGDRHASGWLADLLAKREDLDELRARADIGDEYAAEELARLLAERGDLGELRIRADTGDRFAAMRLAELLAERGDLDGAKQMLRATAATGDRTAAMRLADLLAKREDTDGLRTRADTGDEYAAGELARLLAKRGDLDGLRTRADTGDGRAARELAHLLAERGDLDGSKQMMRAAANVGDKYAAGLLAGRDVDQLRARADTGDDFAARLLAHVLAERGDLDQLRGRADTGDGHAADWLAELLAKREDLDELRARADAGDDGAAMRLAWLLAKRGDLDQLRGRADTGDGHAAGELARLLAERGDLDQLRGRTDVGDRFAADWLPELLTKQGRSEEAARLRRFGLNPDGSIASA